MIGNALHRITIMQEGVRRIIVRWMVAVALWSVSEHKTFDLLTAIASKISPDEPEEYAPPYSAHPGYDRR